MMGAKTSIGSAQPAGDPAYTVVKSRFSVCDAIRAGAAISIHSRCRLGEPTSIHARNYIPEGKTPADEPIYLPKDYISLARRRKLHQHVGLHQFGT